MTNRLTLKLDATGQYLGGPVLGPHDNKLAAPQLLRRHVEELRRVCGH
jgi:hypothetical protein